MSAELIISIASLFANAIFGLILWSIKAQMRDVAREELGKFETLVNARIELSKQEVETAASERWKADSAWNSEFIKRLEVTQTGQDRRIIMLEDAFRATSAIHQRLERIETTLQMLMRGLHISVRENGTNPRSED